MYSISKRIALEEQLAVLRDCGIELRAGITDDDLFCSFGRDELEKQPYRLLLALIGSNLERQPYADISDNIWHMDTECIHGPGAYVHVADRMARLAGESLPITNIRDYVDLEEERAWVSFELDGKKHKWDAEINDDWIDPGILSKFAHLLEERDTGRRFTYLGLGGQDSLIGCSTASQLQRLKDETGFKFTWLS